ncbi:MAG TPA: hypothetical protein VKU41_11980, partial [Polyangiaceae bacterium]|nr:hypothetical protein [Polyangiaceae bacterium]
MKLELDLTATAAVAAIALAMPACTQNDHHAISETASSVQPLCLRTPLPLPMTSGYAPVDGLREYYE